MRSLAEALTVSHMDVYNNYYIYNNGHYNVQPPQYQVYRHTVTERFLSFLWCMYVGWGWIYVFDCT